MAVSSAQFNMNLVRPASAGSPLMPQPTRPALTNPAAAFQSGSAAGYQAPQAQPYNLAASSRAPFPGGGGAVAQGMTGASNPFTPPTPSPLQAPGNNMTNPGYAEQGLNLTQNRLLEDPYAQTTQNLTQQASKPTQGEDYLNQNLGTLDGPGQGSQYWQQQQGQFNDPFAGEQFARQATQNYSPTGAAGAFNDNAQSQYDQWTGFTGAGNSQGQYGQSQSQIGNGTQGQNNMSQIAGGYDQNGQYDGPNRAGGQYEQTQQAFGDMPIANFDPFYDRARQLGVQSYNQDAAGRGVYGSSEALSGVGNVITDIEAQRANRSFDAEMQRAQEQRARQELLGNQARMGDLSGTDAFAANLKGVETYGNLNNQMGQLQNQSMDILGRQANAADTQANDAQNTNISGLNALGNAAQAADSAESRRYEGATNAMNQADQTSIDRLRTGADIAFRADDSERADYQTETNAATSAANTTNNRLATAGNLAEQGSNRDLRRLDSFNDTANTAENSRQGRVQSKIDAVTGMSRDIAGAVGKAQSDLNGASQEDFENRFTSAIAPLLNAAGMSEQDQQAFKEALMTSLNIVTRYSNQPGV